MKEVITIKQLKLLYLCMFVTIKVVKKLFKGINIIENRCKANCYEE